MTATVTIGAAIAVNPVRERGAGDDPLMVRLDQELHDLLGITRPVGVAACQPSLAS